MQRRRFLQSAGLGLTATSPLAQAAFDCYVERTPGAQLFTLRNELADNPIEAIRDLANAGVRDVELFGLTGAPEIFGMSPLSFRRLLERNEITMTCSHVAADALDIPALAENAEILGLDTIILGAAPGFVQPGPNGLRIQGPQTKQEMDELAELLNRLGVMFRRRGLQFAYHNHHVEFFEVDGEIPFNHIMWNTDPQMVRCELDIGWLALAGVDYLNVLDNFGNRTIACHMKDFNGNRPADMGISLALPPAWCRREAGWWISRRSWSAWTTTTSAMASWKSIRPAMPSPRSGRVCGTCNHCAAADSH